MESTLRAAACHASPIFLNASKTTEKALFLIHQATKNKANLIVFPESFIPAFPHWSSIRSPSENHDLFKTMAKQSLYIDGPEINSIREAARTTKTVISLGLSEKARYSSATLFNTNIIIGTDGELLVYHRKLQPTFFEKLTWSPGDGFGLRVADTRYGKIGALVCGENTNPLARYSLIAAGEQVHISSWPAIWPTRVSEMTTEDYALKKDTDLAEPKKDNKSASKVASSSVNYDNVRANRTRAAAHCFEAKCFGIMSSGHLDSDAISICSTGSRDPSAIAKALETSPRGATMFLDPTGAPLRAFVMDAETGERRETEYLQHEEGILYADINLDDCIEGKSHPCSDSPVWCREKVSEAFTHESSTSHQSLKKHANSNSKLTGKQYHDLVGGYQRFDVFDLKVDRRRKLPATFTAGEIEM